MQKIEYNINKLEDFLDLPLNIFLRWLAPSTFELAEYRFGSMVNQLQQSAHLPKEDQKKKLDEFVALIKSVYENEYLGFLRPYLTLPLRDFVKELNRILHLSAKNDFLFRDLPSQERNTLLAIFESKRSKRIMKGSGSLVDILWVLTTLNRLAKLSTWSEHHIGAGIGAIHFNRKKILAFIWAIFFKKKENFEEIIHDLASSMFGEIILKIAEYQKINEIYPKLVTLLEKEKEAANEKAENDKLPTIEDEKLDIEQDMSSLKLTQSQWVLVYYYFFKQNGLEPRVTMDISPLARFIHLATGIKYSTVQNSDIYTKLSKAPNFKADKELLKDLEKIRPIFESHGFNEILQVIDKEIDICKKRR